MPGSTPLGTPSGNPATTAPGTATVGAGSTTPTRTGSGKRALADEASGVAQDAGDAGRRVVDTAKDETRGVAEETRHQVRRITDQLGGELREQAANQQVRAAKGLRSVGSDFSQMADGSASSGYATDLVRQAGRKADDVAQWLDARDPGALLQEVKSFARRRPGLFLAIAVGAGIVAGRLTRALTASDDDGSAAASGTTARPRAQRTSERAASGSSMGGTPVAGRPDLAGDRFPETASAEGAPYPAEGGGLR